MRKAILASIVVLALASVVSAVPAGPGGTIYFGSSSNTGWPTYLPRDNHFYYLDVDSNWDPLLTADACVWFASLHNAGDNTTDGDELGSPEVWYHPTSGYRDMNGSYHDATLLVGAFYNNTPYVAEPGLHQDSECADILTLAPDGTLTLLNDGIIYSWAAEAIMATSSLGFVLPVDSGYTPGGEARGIVAESVNNDSIWVDSDGDGAYNEGVQQDHGSSDDLEYVPGIGVVSPRYNGIDIIYAGVDTDGNRTYNKVEAQSGSPDHGFKLSGSIAAADTNDDGIADLYYMAPGYQLIHAYDQNDDLDTQDDGEAWVIYDEDTEGDSDFDAGNQDLELVQCPGGEWVLLLWDNTEAWHGRRWINVMGLDSDGEWDGNPMKEIIGYSAWNATGDSSIMMYAANTFEFAPLLIPEPATMLLVGTGILGLAGVIRRRFIH
ncbi:hypothetical protein ES707_14125 [subsurface metagenome]